MSDEAKDREIVESVRASESAKGRTYTGTGVEPEWLANETMEYCKTQGWESSLKKVPNSNNLASCFGPCSHTRGVDEQ